MPAQQVDAMLNPLPVTVVEADRGLATSAGHLRTVTAKVGLSLGDRFCRALAKRDGLDETPSVPPAGIRAGLLFCASARLKQWAA